MSITPCCLLLFILIGFYLSEVLTLSLSSIPYMDPETLDALRSSKKIKEFIKYLHIPNEDLCYPVKDEKIDPMLNPDLPFGDLIMDEEAGESDDKENDYGKDEENDMMLGMTTSENNNEKKKKPKKWKSGVVPYYISNDFTAEQKQKIEKVIEIINSKLTKVKFRRHKRFDRDYAMILSGKGCFSALGMKGGPQPVSLQSDKCLKDGTIQHELMHVLGFSHEQNRPDRDKYIKVMYDNIPDKWRKNYKRYRPSDILFPGQYDYFSVMHYPPQAPESHGDKLAFKILDDSVDIKKIGERNEISNIDLQKVEKLYSD